MKFVYSLKPWCPATVRTRTWYGRKMNFTLKKRSIGYHTALYVVYFEVFEHHSPKVYITDVSWTFVLCVFFSLMEIMIVMWIYGFWVVELKESWRFNIICCNHCHKYHFRKLSSWENARVFSNLGFFSGYYEEDVRGTIFFK